MINEAVAQAAREVVERYFETLNRCDAQAVHACFNFPHIRIGARGNVSYYADISANPFGAFLARVDEDDWDHSVLDRLEVVFTAPHKAHVAIDFRRLRADGSEIGAYHSLYVVTSIDGHWGIQAGSGTGG